MTDKELRKLRRDDLLQILISQQRQIDELKTSLEQVEEQLSKRTIAIAESGTLAEAALKLNRVYEAAQASADQYQEQMRARADEMHAQAEAEMAEAKRASEDLLKSTRSEAERILRDARSEGERVKAEAQKLLDEARQRTGVEPPPVSAPKGEDEEDGKQRRGLLWRNRKA